MLRGINSAALPKGDCSWIGLVAADVSPALEAQLVALKHMLAEAPIHDAVDRSVRLAAVRAIMAELGVDGFIVPRADEYQNEYVPACNERLAWLTGFTGSAGVLLVTMNRALLVSDGRYRTQAGEQVDAAGAGDVVELTIGGVTAQREALAEAAGSASVIALEA